MTKETPSVKPVSVYVIFSADFMRSGVNTMNFMDPHRNQGGTGPTFPELAMTESDDDGNEFDYLVDEVGPESCSCEDSKGIVWRDHEGSIMHPDTTDYGRGRPVRFEIGFRYRRTRYGWEVATPCTICGGTGNRNECYRGPHRKWAGELSYEQWERFASRYCIDVDEWGWPETYEETMGSITEFGMIPAIRVDNTEGWNSGYDDGGVIDSSFYLSFMMPEGYQNA